jgi:hypothetical protein
MGDEGDRIELHQLHDHYPDPRRVSLISVFKRGVSSNAGLSGWVGGLAASGIAATFYATNCFDDNSCSIRLQPAF